MDIILLEKIHNLGDLGDKVTVAAGFGRNFLIPKGKAVPATEDNVKMFEQRRAELEAKAAADLAAAEARAEKLNGMVVTISSKAGDEGKLFGSIGTQDIADAVNAEGVELVKKEVRMPDGVLRLVGEYDIDVYLPSDVQTAIKVVVVAEE